MAVKDDDKIGYKIAVKRRDSTSYIPKCLRGRAISRTAPMMILKYTAGSQVPLISYVKVAEEGHFKGGPNWKYALPSQRQ